MADSNDKRTAFMERRRAHGLTFQQLGDAFGTSKSTAHRKLNAAKPGGNMAKLPSKERNKLPKSEFAGSNRSYPVNDKSHAANAKARATQQVKKGNLSPASAAKIDAKANKMLGKGPKMEKVNSDRGEFTIKSPGKPKGM